MKKKLFTIAIALCMVFTMIPRGVFQIETAWAASGDTPASVKVGGVEMVGTDVTYYKNDGKTGSADDYNAMYDKTANTLTLKGFTYNGTAIGIEADGALNIVVVGKNNTINSTAHGIWTQDDLTISGTSKNRDKLTVTSSEADAIFAYDSYWAYAESITISNVDIEALSNASVGICASSTVEITDSHVVSTGAKFGIQGGFFNRDQENGSGNTGAITIVRSYIKAKATSTTIGEAKALEEVVTVNGESYDNSKKEKVVIIGESHEHYLCGTECKAIGDHQMEESKITFNKKIWMDDETLKIDDAAWTKDTTSNVERYKLPEGSYYLDDNIELDASILTEGSVNLCLNGNTITGAAQGQVITVGENSEFSLSDCRADDKQGSITHKTSVLGKGVYNTGEFFLYGGNITGNDSDSSKTNFNGGGVTNHNGATFIMYGGSITENKATNGAGVYNAAQGTYPTKDTVFKMYGGTISGNQASYMGGGVLNQGDFTMKGGIIGGTEDSEKNTARIGGGVHVSSQWASTAGIFAMKGGKIVGNAADENGGGVFVEVKTDGTLIGTFNVSGNAVIARNKANSKDDNVYLGMSTGGTKTASIEIGGTLTGSQKIGVKTAKTPTGGDDTVTIATEAKSGDENYFVSDDSNYVVAYDNGKLVLKTNLTPPATEHKHYLCGKTHTEVGDHTSDEETKFTAWTRTDSLPDTAGNYYLTEDVTLTSAVEYRGGIGKDYCGWDVPDGVVLCLNGKNITMKNPDGMTDEVDVIKVSGHFTLTDCKTGDAQGKITHATDASSTKCEGKGVKVLGGTFDMFGGIISGNTTNYDIGGGGVSVEGVSDTTKASIFKLYGGKISGNTAKSGGGVHVRRIVWYGPSEFHMYGGSITNNNADSTAASYGVGGGVYVSWTSKFIMDGGTISENTATQFGGGVYASALARKNAYDSGGAAELKFSGTATITGNKAGNEKSNVYLDSDTSDSNYETVSVKIAITEPLTGTIGVTTKDLPTAGRPVTIATGAAAGKNYSTNITSDKNGYEIGHASNPTELILKVTGDPNPAPAPVTAPTISEQPKNLEITYGKTGNFAVKATAATDTAYKPLQYQWYKNTTNSNTGGTKIEGATSATYSVPTDTPVGNYYYYCVVTATRTDNQESATASSEIAKLTVSKAPVTVTVNNQNAYINGTLPANSYKAEGLVNGDKFNETSVKYEYKDAKDETVTPNLEQAGTYTIKISGLTLANADNYDVTYKPGTLTITQKSSGGSGGSSTRTEVITTGTIDSKVTSSPTEVKNETKTDANGNSVTTATVTVSSANQREILRQAKANKSGEIIIKVSQNEVKDGAKLELNLDKSFIQSIINDTDAKLTVQTPSGEKTFTQDELKKLAAEAAGNTVTIDPTSAGTTELTDPTEPTDPAADKNAKLIKGIENTTIVLKSKLTKNGNVLLTWTKSKGYKVDYFEFYRSVKRYSGYGTKAFFTTADGSWSKYLNTKELEAGKTYYYKVRGVRVIDGQKYYTQWSNKAWRTIK